LRYIRKIFFCNCLCAKDNTIRVNMCIEQSEAGREETQKNSRSKKRVALKECRSRSDVYWFTFRSVKYHRLDEIYLWMSDFNRVLLSRTWLLLARHVFRRNEIRAEVPKLSGPQKRPTATPRWCVLTCARVTMLRSCVRVQISVGQQLPTTAELHNSVSCFA